MNDGSPGSPHFAAVSPACVNVEPSKRLRHKQTREVLGVVPLFKYAPVQLINPEDYERVCPECGGGVYRKPKDEEIVLQEWKGEPCVVQQTNYPYRCTNCAHHRVEEKA